MFNYDVDRLKPVIMEMTCSNIEREAWIWLKEGLGIGGAADLNAAFSLMPRKTGKNSLKISEEQTNLINEIRPGFSVKGWTSDQLARICLLIHLDANDKEEYFKKIENLFRAAEVAELVALYSSLPLLAWPELWKLRCAEGIRSNIGNVLEAIMYNNLYPSENLNENAWNQLVLKAFFTEKDVNRIYGLDERANPVLAHTLSDYAHERWAAQRRIDPKLWRLTGRFMDKALFNDIQRVFDEGDLRERQAAALTAFTSDYEPALQLLNRYPEFKQAIEKNELSWEMM